MSRFPAALAAVARAGRAAISIAVVLAAGAGLAMVLAGRTDPAGGSAGGGPLAAGASASSGSTGSGTPTEPSSGASPGPSTGPSVAVSTAVPSAEPDPTPNPTTSPTPTPTPARTPAPTRQPTATPRPTHDPAPEPTPYIGKASGQFGQTLIVDGIRAYLARRAPQDPSAVACGTSDDPEMQGFTDIVSYDLRITWPDPGDAFEPWIAVGTTPYNALWFDPGGTFRSSVDYIFSTCKRPADSDKAMIEVASNGGDPALYRFYFR